MRLSRVPSGTTLISGVGRTSAARPKAEKTGQYPSLRSHRAGQARRCCLFCPLQARSPKEAQLQSRYRKLKSTAPVWMLTNGFGSFLTNSISMCSNNRITSSQERRSAVFRQRFAWWRSGHSKSVIWQSAQMLSAGLRNDNLYLNYRGAGAAKVSVLVSSNQNKLLIPRIRVRKIGLVLNNHICLEQGGEALLDFR